MSSFPPEYAHKTQQASENLRRALPLINKHKTPVNPVNYAIWYEYVSGENQALTDAIDNRLSKQEVMTPEFTQLLYTKYVLMDMPDRIEKTNNGLKIVVDNTLNNINKVESVTGQCIKGLNDSQSELASCQDISEVKDLVGDIIANTKALSETSSELKQELAHSSDEINKLKQELAAVKVIARTDGLTGLLNRGAFNTELTALCQQASTDTALILFDLDHFKNLNDTFGHLLGDKVIQFFAGLLKKHAGEQHLCARYGGEEMAMILINVSQQQAMNIANNVREKFAESRLKKKGSSESIGQITVSAGVSMLQQNDTIEKVIDRADQALYQSKESGRNKVTLGS